MKTVAGGRNQTSKIHPHLRIRRHIHPDDTINQPRIPKSGMRPHRKHHSFVAIFFTEALAHQRKSLLLSISAAPPEKCGLRFPVLTRARSLSISTAIPVLKLERARAIRDKLAGFQKISLPCRFHEPSFFFCILIRGFSSDNERDNLYSQQSEALSIFAHRPQTVDNGRRDKSASFLLLQTAQNGKRIFIDPPTFRAVVISG